MKYLLFVLMFSQTACAEEPQFIHSQIKPYYDLFMVDAGKNGALVKMSYVDEINFKVLPDNKLAVCEINWQSTKLYKRIFYNSRQWASLHDTARLEVMYHEMGHCSFKKFNHYPEDGHIMYAYNITQWKDPVWIETNWPGLVKKYWEYIKK